MLYGHATFHTSPYSLSGLNEATQHEELAVDLFLQSIVNSLIQGGFFALWAVGMVLVFTDKMIFFYTAQFDGSNIVELY